MTRNLRPNLNRSDLSAGVLSGVLYVSAFPPFGFWIASLFFLVPVFARCRRHDNLRQSFWTGFFAGLVGWCGLIYWLCHATGAGVSLLVLVLALYWGVFFAIASRFRATPFRWIFLPLVWVIFEAVRSVGYLAFAWGLVGQALGSFSLLLNTTSVTGVLPLSALAILVNLGISEFLETAPAPLRKVFFLKSPASPPAHGSAICFLAILTLGFVTVCGLTLTFSPDDTRKGQPLRVAAIQGNYPLDEKLEEDIDATLDRYLELSRSAREEGAELAVWPESALTYPLRYWPGVVNRVQAFCDETGMDLLVGSVDGNQIDLGEGREHWTLYNSAFLFRPGAMKEADEYPCDLSPIQRYDKIRLVPWGEMVPLGKWWPFSLIESVIESAGGGIFEPGTEITIFEGPHGAKFGVSICFESTLPGLAHQQRELGADFLVNITNDAWFKRSTAPYQHLQQCIFRAVENRCWVVRAANTGFSAIVDPRGDVIARTDLFERGYALADIYPDSGRKPQ
ncbi:MAG TPA: apolipoprotein N-acyltransferase [bacterium]|nr:apolipoprotein N-acyltransferase [bacterium]